MKTEKMDPWRQFWGPRDLPLGMEVHGIVTRTDGETGALLFDGARFYLGNHGHLRRLPDLVVTRTLTEGDTVRYQGRLWTIRSTQEVGHLLRIVDDHGVTEYVLREALE